MSLASVRWKSRRRFQLLSKFSTDRPPLSCMKPLSLPPPRSKQATRWAQSSGSKTCARVRIGAGGQGAEAGFGRGDRPKIASTRSASSKGATSTTRSIGSRMTQDRSAPKARAISPPSHRKTIEGNRASSAISGPAPDSAATAKKAASPSSTRRRLADERRKRGFRRRIGGRTEEGERDGAAGKGIEGQPMAARIEEKGAVARLGAGLERKVELFGHRFPSIGAAGSPKLARADASGKNLILMDNRRPILIDRWRAAAFSASRFAEVNASLSPWT